MAKFTFIAIEASVPRKKAAAFTSSLFMARRSERGVRCSRWWFRSGFRSSARCGQCCLLTFSLRIGVLIITQCPTLFLCVCFGILRSGRCVITPRRSCTYIGLDSWRCCYRRCQVGLWWTITQGRRPPCDVGMYDWWWMRCTWQHLIGWRHRQGWTTKASKSVIRSS